MFYRAYCKVYEDFKFIARIDFDDVYENINYAMSDVLSYIAKMFYVVGSESKPILKIDNNEIKLLNQNKTFEFFISRTI